MRQDLIYFIQTKISKILQKFTKSEKTQGQHPAMFHTAAFIVVFCWKRNLEEINEVKTDNGNKQVCTLIKDYYFLPIKICIFLYFVK